ncbi:hypothetical protein RIF29_26713 [Crotalaria pallida]|uniref:Damage-control phosphatase ARMT1-like metal-binding domain-containing protein n=1 Tax=Crotalaria pallida TaxID=3830 RepID=A0AAN9EN09_CROPI
MPPHRRALLFVDNSGADIVLGMLPLARELLRRGTEVVLVANSLPALNDVTAMELPDIFFNLIREKWSYLSLVLNLGHHIYF